MEIIYFYEKQKCIAIIFNNGIRNLIFNVTV
jgi:hypothetical protein